MWIAFIQGKRPQQHHHQGVCIEYLFFNLLSLNSIINIQKNLFFWIYHVDTKGLFLKLFKQNNSILIINNSFYHKKKMSHWMSIKIHLSSWEIRVAPAKQAHQSGVSEAKFYWFMKKEIQTLFVNTFSINYFTNTYPSN